MADIPNYPYAHGKNVNSERHYHIRWSKSDVDWKPFPTSYEAGKVAERIKRPSESYIIEEYDAECERCRVFRSNRARG